MTRMMLFNIVAGLLLLLALVVLLSWKAMRRKQSTAAPLWFAASYFCGSIGMFLEAYRGIIPDFLGVVLGNILFMLLYVGIEKAMSIYSGLRSMARWTLLISVLGSANLAYYTYVKPNISLRTLESTFVYIVLLMFIVRHAFGVKSKLVRPAMHAMGGVLLAHCLPSLVRIVDIVRSGKPDIWIEWVDILTVTALPLFFIWVDVLRLRHELEQNALIDPLTELPNRRALEDHVVRELSRAQRNNSPVSAIVIDINHFKQINDIYGHSAGDTALRSVATALLASLRSSDLATRIGGDEFFVLLPDTDEASLDLIVSRLRTTVEDLKLETFYGEGFQVSISIGAVTCRERGTSVQNLLNRCDIMLYREKETVHGFMLEKVILRQPLVGEGDAHVQPSRM